MKKSKKVNKKKIVRDLKPKKDAKGGGRHSGAGHDRTPPGERGDRDPVGHPLP
jgi:hypothetical protein